MSADSWFQARPLEIRCESGATYFRVRLIQDCLELAVASGPCTQQAIDAAALLVAEALASAIAAALARQRAVGGAERWDERPTQQAIDDTATSLADALGKALSVQRTG